MQLQTDGNRLWDSLMEMARIGATEKGGVKRVAFTDLDRQGRGLFRDWAVTAGCEVRVDGFGNMFARRAGLDPDAPVVMVGSHLDSQPTGGKFDGAYGVLAGLEIVRAMNDADLRTRAPIEVVNWTNEEGYIFKPMIGSEVWTGLLDLDEALAMRADDGGWTIAEGLQRIGYAGEAGLMGSTPVACYLEAHIEQGPVLEMAGEWLGVVDATQGQRWYDVVLTGREAHAGPTPMEARQDSMMGMSRVALEVDRIARAHPPGCGTVGRVHVFPNSPNTIPGRVAFSSDLRHPEGTVLAAMDVEFRAAVAAVAEERKLTVELTERARILPMPFNTPLADVMEARARASGHPWRRMYTGAGHDACNIARFLPTAMLFVPCRDGISHNEAEHAEQKHLAAGAQVLAETVRAAADGEVDFRAGI